MATSSVNQNREGLGQTNSSAPEKMIRDADNASIFVWSNYRQWRRTILRLLADLVDKTVFTELGFHPPRYFSSDNLSWLDEAIQRAKHIAAPDTWTTLVDRIGSHYRYVRAYHGCRTVSLDSYRQRGLVPWDIELLNDLARQIFTPGQRLEHVITQLTQDSYAALNRGKVFFCLDVNHLVERCGHYLLCGSEYLQCLAVRIGEQDRLRRRGQATLVECNVPLADIPVEFVRDLAGACISEIFEIYFEHRPRTPCLNFGFWIKTAISPSDIVGFQFPTRIANSDNRFIRED